MIGPALVAEAFRSLLLQSKDPYSLFHEKRPGDTRSECREECKREFEHQEWGCVCGEQGGVGYACCAGVCGVWGKGLKVFAVSQWSVRSNLRGTSEEARSGWRGAGGCGCGWRVGVEYCGREVGY